MNRTVRLAIVTALGVALLSSLALAALPYWLGYQAEKTYRALLNDLTLTTGLPVTLKRYERGWRHSDAETDIALPALSLTLTARHALQHSPWTEHGWAPLLARVSGDIRFASTTGHPPPVALTLQGDVDLRGAVQLTFDWPATQLAWAGGNLQWQPLRATLHTDRDGNRIQGQLGGPILQFGDQHAEHWQIQFDVRPNETAFPLGQLNLKIGRLTAAPFWEAAALQLSISSHSTGETVALKINGQLEKLRMAEDFYGPGEFTLEGRALEPLALTQFVRALPTLFHDADMTKLVPPLTALARKMPEVKLTALHLKAATESATAPAGRTSDASRASKSARGPADVPDSRMPRRPGMAGSGLYPIGDALTGRGSLVLDGRRLGATPHPARLLRAFNGELTVSVSAPLLTSWLLADTETDDSDRKETLPDSIAANPYARLFTPTKTGYGLSMTLKRGQLLINNKPWHGPLPIP